MLRIWNLEESKAFSTNANKDPRNCSQEMFTWDWCSVSWWPLWHSLGTARTAACTCRHSCHPVQYNWRLRYIILNKSFIPFFRVRWSSDSSVLACCKAGPGSNPVSAPHRGPFLSGENCWFKSGPPANGRMNVFFYLFISINSENY